MKRQGGYTVFELIVVLSILGVLFGVLYGAKAYQARLTAGRFEAMSQVMDHIAESAAQTYVKGCTDPMAGFADIGYTPPAHPFQGTYGFSILSSGGKRVGVKVTSTIPKGTGRALGPGAFLESVDASWDRAVIVRPFPLDHVWPDKSLLYGEDPC